MWCLGCAVPSYPVDEGGARRVRDDLGFLEGLEVLATKVHQLVESISVAAAAEEELLVVQRLREAASMGCCPAYK
jgi:hypothetical protein